MGASSSVVLTGHPTASPDLRQGIVPSFFCRKRNKGKERNVALALFRETRSRAK